MIRVPANWSCAQFPCACVEYAAGQFCLCSVLPTSGHALSFQLNIAVRLTGEQVARLLSQDCSRTEEISISWIARPDSGEWKYTPVTDGCTSGGDVLRIRCPLETSTAVTVTLAGPRLDARATPAHLRAVLAGCCVAVDSTVRLGAAQYRVVGVQKSGCGAVSVVGGQCKVKVNDTAATQEGASRPTCPVGLEETARDIRDMVMLAHKVPGMHTGAVIHGPHGCGVSSLVHYVEQSSPEADALTWCPTFDARAAAKRTRCRVVMLLISACELVFSEAEKEIASMSLRKLEKDVALITADANGFRPSVVVLAFTHSFRHCSTALVGSFFAKVVRLSLPDADQRAALIAHVRGGTSADWRPLAQSLVGKSCAETLAVAAHGDWKYQLPFRPVRWADVGGLEDVKDRLQRALIWPQQHPDVFQRFALDPPKGVLLYGPPGCAKTTLVKALCSEGYFSLIYLDSATVVSAYVGESERQLREVFAKAAQQAPCVVFFDEVEVIGAKRAAGSHNAENVRLLSTLLTELDGFNSARGVCFVGATNVPHLIDSALLRPGRFDFLVHVPLPARKDRADILQLCLQSTPLDYNLLADLTDGFSGADLSSLCSSALLELLGNADEPPACLSDKEWMTTYMRGKVEAFHKTPYDVTALEEFHREHS